MLKINTGFLHQKKQYGDSFGQNQSFTQKGPSLCKNNTKIQKLNNKSFQRKTQ